MDRWAEEFEVWWALGAGVWWMAWPSHWSLPQLVLAVSARLAIKRWRRSS
jgi:hypothetical protein